MLLGRYAGSFVTMPAWRSANVPINSSNSNVCSGLLVAVQFQLHQKTQVQTSKISLLVLKARMIVLSIEIVQKSPHIYCATTVITIYSLNNVFYPKELL